MARSLGIFVSSNKHLDKIVKLCHAAVKKNVEVSIFFTHMGILLTQDPRFCELEGMARMSLCNVGFRDQGLKPPVSGISAKNFITQAGNGDIIEECDRYLVF